MSSRETLATISIEGETLGRGETIKMVCPFCDGGQSNEAKFYLTKDSDTGLLLYCCHRASCGRSGRLGSGTGRVPSTAPVVKKFEPWDDRDFKPIGMTIGRWDSMIYPYIDKYPFTREYRELQWDYQTNRLATPIHDWRGYKVGYVLRTLTGATPKTLIARLTDQVTMIDWYHGLLETRTFVLVEDQQSAARLLSSGVAAIALLGCTPSDEMLREIVERKPLKLWVALDPGAERAAFKLHRRLFAHVDTQVALLRQDIKDMDAEEYNAWLESYGFSHQ